MNLAKLTSAIRVSNAVAAGTSAVNSGEIDMQNYESCLIIFAFGTIVSGAATSVKAQGSSDDAAADAYADLEGTSITVADDDDNQIVILEIVNPKERYVRGVISRATQNATVDGIFVLRSGAKKLPATDDSATVVASETHVSPAEGTA